MIQYVKIEITNPLSYDYSLDDYNASTEEKLNQFLHKTTKLDYNDKEVYGDSVIFGQLFLKFFSLSCPPWAGTSWSINMFRKDSLNFEQFKCEFIDGRAIISGNLFFKLSFKDEAYHEMVNYIENLYIDSFNLEVFFKEGQNEIRFNRIGNDYKVYFDMVHKNWKERKEIGPERKIKVTFAKKIKEVGLPG